MVASIRAQLARELGDERIEGISQRLKPQDKCQAKPWNALETVADFGDCGTR